MGKIRIGVVGYGNLGRGVHIALKQNEDMELVAIFTRRAPESVKTLFPAKVDKIDNIKEYIGKIDVMVMCGGSATDLPEQTPNIAKYFNTIDSFDTHAKIPAYFETVDKIAKDNKNLSLISVGWDPGLFSIMRGLFDAVLPKGNTYTFWGKGVSQGHSDAIRRIKGVKNAIQYTIPIEEALNRVRNLENPELTTGEKHLRECFVVADENADLKQIEKEIVTMPNYFADYKTIVHFISEEELKKNHSKISHGGLVLRSGESANDNDFLLEFSLKLESNPEFTSSVIVAFTRALYRMRQEGFTGCKTVLDIPLGYLSPKGDSVLRKELV